MPESYWNKIQEHWSRLGPPLRPPPEVAAAMQDYVLGKILLLGVTPELAGLGNVTAIDSSEAMIKYIWPGDTPTRRARLGDWRQLSFDAEFGSVIGDGSLNAVSFPDGVLAVLRGAARALQPGGTFACRLFATPSPCESLGDVQDSAMGGAIKNFHALKWRVAMAAVAAQSNPNIEVGDILAHFNRLFPDRRELSRRSGWPVEIINTIDAYNGSADCYSFPTVGHYLSLIPPEFIRAREVPTGNYELAERCPLLVAERAA